MAPVVTLEQIRSFRLRAHHLDRPLPVSELLRAAGACGLQNSPPGAWETALWNRLEGCSSALLRDALYRDKTLLQAWSYRGAPVVFPTTERDIFLTSLRALPGEEPWVYTAGISGALDFLGLPFSVLLPLVMEAAGELDRRTIVSKEALDQALADQVKPLLPPDKRPLWHAPSMYGHPDRQTVGGAAVSFLLRPCSFSSLVVFGRREGTQPTFTSPGRWLGRQPEPVKQPERLLVRKFLRCFGPSTSAGLGTWLGCSTPQARRLWNTVAGELAPVTVEGRTRYALQEDLPELTGPACCGDRLLLLGPHDPYLDTRDRSSILSDPALQKLVWRTVGNPGVLLRGGAAVGCWRVKTVREQLDFTLTPFRPLTPEEERGFAHLAEEYAAFRCAGVKKLSIASL